MGKAYERAHEICKLSGDAPQLFPAVWGLWIFYTACAEHGKAYELAHQCRRIAEAVNDTDLLMMAHQAMGVTLETRAQFDSALSELDQGIAIYNREKHAPLAFTYGQDTGVACRSQAAFGLWFLGLPEQALKRNDEALALAREVSHPYSLACALGYSAWLYQLCQDEGAVEKDAEAAIAVSTEGEFVFWLLTGMILLGWALTAGNKVDEGIALIRQGLAGYRATGAGIMRPYYLALMAQALATTGELEEALRLLDEAEAAVRNSGERWYEAELHRLKGRLALRDSARAPEDERRKTCRAIFRPGPGRRPPAGRKDRLSLERPRNSAGFGQAETRPRRPSGGSQRSTAASKKGSDLRTCGTPTLFFRRDEQAGRFHPRVPRWAIGADGAARASCQA